MAKDLISWAAKKDGGATSTGLGELGSELLSIGNLPSRNSDPDQWGAWWRSFLRGGRLPDASRAARLRVVDLFCGAGGFALGVSLAARAFNRRARIERAVDTDFGALRVHARSLDVGRTVHTGVSSLVDYQVRERQGRWCFAYPPEIISPDFSIPPGVDLVTAGPPCQGHSNLNNHTRRSDPRNDLYICTVAVAVALKAKAILIENVRAVEKSHVDVVGMARQLLNAAGYAVTHDIVRADRLGWPQTRERFFLTAVRGPAVETPLPVREPRSVMWAIEDLKDIEGGAGPFDAAPDPTDETRKRIDWLFEHDQHDLPNSERPDCHKNGTTYTSVYGRMHHDRPAPTITTGIGTPGQGRFIHPIKPRLITPHEAARIQGFPDGYGFLEDGVHARRRDLAKWIGDAVPSPMGFEMAKRAFAALGLEPGASPIPKPANRRKERGAALSEV